MPRALITGITGQDGLYLGELLTRKGYEVFGLVRGQSNPKVALVEHIIPGVQLLEGDLTDLSSLIGAMEVAQPDEVYNLGAISFVGLSWRQAELTGEITGMGVLRMLEAIRMSTSNDMSRVRFYQASSSEMFGKVREVPQRETTPFHPRSPYGVAKVFGHYMTVNYRESYGMHAPQRHPVQPRVAAARAGVRDPQGHRARWPGSSSACRTSSSSATWTPKRDWGFAGDYVEAMWLMLQQDEPDDYVIATGETHSVRELLEVAFARVGIETGRRTSTQDPRFFRPAEVDLLLGDAGKAQDRARLGAERGFERAGRDDGRRRPGGGEAHRGRALPRRTVGGPGAAQVHAFGAPTAVIGRTGWLLRHGSPAPAPAPAAGDPVSSLVRMTSTAPPSAAGTAVPADRGSGTVRPGGPAAMAPVLVGEHGQVDVALATESATAAVGEAAPVPAGGRRQSPGSSPAMQALRGASPLALAGMLATAVNVGVTLLIARMLTTRGYGALAQLIALFFVLSMPGSALLVGVVRRVTAWRRVSRLDLVANWVRVTRRRALVLVILFSLLAIALRGVIAEWMNLPSPAGVAETLSAGAVWGLLSLDRGLLQAGHAYPALGRNLIVEGLSRCLLTVALVAVGLGVQGATLAILVSVIFADFDARRSLTALDLYDPTRIPADPGPADGDLADG